MMSENRKMIIYKTTNLITNKIYIGKHIRNRNDYIGSGIAFKKAVIKYGKENFKKEVVEECKTLDELNQREMYWIKYFNSTNRNIGYNISYGGDGFMGITEETKEKIRLKHIGKHISVEAKLKISLSNKNKPKSETHKMALKNAWKKRKINYPHTAETLSRMRNSMMGKNTRSYNIIDINENIYKITGICDFCKNNKLNRTMLVRKSKKNMFYKGWKVKEWVL